MAQAQHANLPGPGAISMTDDTIHTCSYECERPGCIRAQRDELVAKVEALSTDLRAMRAELERAMEARQLISDDLATAEARADKLAEALRESHGEVLRLRAAMFRVCATAANGGDPTMYIEQMRDEMNKPWSGDKASAALEQGDV